MAFIIQIRRDTAANWAAVNPILAQGEPALETDTKKEKIGDGISSWNALPYKNATLGDSLYLGSFATEAALSIAHPTAIDGNYAIVQFTDTVWIWDVDTLDWVDSGNPQGLLPINSVGFNELKPEVTDLLNPSSSDIPTDTTNFDKNLSVADDTVQKALETLDELVGVIAENIDVLELDHPFKTEIDLGSVSGAVTIDWSLAGRYKLNLTGNVTITMTNYSAYAVAKVQDIFIKSSGTGYTITWQSGVDVTDFTAVPIDFSLTTIVNHISVRCLNATTPNFQMSNYLIP